MADTSNSADIIDSRDIISRLDELQERADDESDSLDEDETEELRVLTALASECDQCADWRDGAALISDQYFVTYAQELAEDLGGAKPTEWPYTHIDWEAAAEALQSDYTSVSYDGETFWIRS